MRIKKIYIKNFKGIKDMHTVDFNNQTTLLTGPNGFGKTTIFDVLELCLTGSIHRTIKKSNVTKDINDYKKPFYQNTEKEDVVLKLWLQNSKDEDLIIVKHLPVDHPGASNPTERKNKPKDFDLLKTFKDQADNFSNEDFKENSDNELKQEEIDTFFGLEEEDFRIKNIYTLFNYLQQEEATFFLKKSENERSTSLGFLFKTDKQEKERDEINNKLRKLKEFKRDLQDKLTQKEKESNTSEIPYTSLFPDQNIPFDKKDLFLNLDEEIARADSKKFLSELQTLEDFVKVFSPLDYEKKQKLNKYNEIIKKEDFLNYLLLNEFKEQENFQAIKTAFESAANTVELKSFVLQKYIPKMEIYKKINRDYSEYLEFKKTFELDIFSEQISPLSKMIKRIKPESLNEFKKRKNDYNDLVSTSNEIDLAFKEILNAREKIKKNIKEKLKDELDNNSCPYCGKDWEEHELLEEHFDKQSQLLEKLAGEQTTKIKEMEEKIKNEFVLELKEEVSEYLETNRRIDKDFLKELESLRETPIPDLTLFIDSEKLSNYIWEDIEEKSIGELNRTINELTKTLKKHIPVTEDIWEILNKINFIAFNEELEFIKNEMPEINLEEFRIKYDVEFQVNKNKLAIEKRRLKEEFENQAKQFSFESSKAEDKEDYYKIIFNKDSRNFEKISVEEIQKKKAYVKQSFENNQNKLFHLYENRKEKIDKLIKKTEEIKNIYNTEIEAYKREMTEAIQLRFYIYTAKILQNYQQGKGVFLSSSDTRDSIRFLTDQSSDHDAIHHLSSGQLAVISLAFTLAINSTYNISKELKFLVIDDPIQDMDSLNIHSFVELIRHEFLEDYQLILSTHNDMNAWFIKYKFERMAFDKIKTIDVQSSFF